MGLRIFDTMTRTLRDFEPLEPGRVRMYVCGPTVYNYFHIGNLRPFLFFDVARRYLEYRGYEVIYVQNITDVEDKIINRALETGTTAAEVAGTYTRAFFADLDAMGVRRATVHPRATAHIPEMIDLIERLVAGGHAYVQDGDVYYRARSFPSYGALSHQSLDDLIAGARVAVDERKEDPLDFALWKAAKPGEPSWPSPWGEGRPGWHIECSAMSMKYLGPTLDIHAGGSDLVFPHHENEIAQSEAATGQTFARYWMHVAYVNIEGTKMSKSLGNIVTVRDLRRQYEPAALRHFLLSSHYRTPLNYSAEALAASARGLARLRGALHRMADIAAGQHGDAASGGGITDLVAAARERFVAAMDDDFNTAGAIAALFDLAREANTAADRGLSPAEARGLLNGFDELGSVLGFYSSAPAQAGTAGMDGLVSVLAGLRQEARQKRDFATADRIRAELQALGIILEDTPAGTRWRVETRGDDNRGE